LEPTIKYIQSDENPFKNFPDCNVPVKDAKEIFEKGQSLLTIIYEVKIS